MIVKRKLTCRQPRLARLFEHVTITAASLVLMVLQYMNKLFFAIGIIHFFIIDHKVEDRQSQINFEAVLRQINHVIS